MPQNVRGESLGFQGRTCVDGRGNMLIEDMLEARASEGLCACIEEQFRNTRFASDGKPCAQAACDSFPEGKDALLPPFPHHPEIHVARTKRRDSHLRKWGTIHFGEGSTTGPDVDYRTSIAFGVLQKTG